MTRISNAWIVLRDYRQRNEMPLCILCATPVDILCLFSLFQVNESALRSKRDFNPT